MNQWLKSNKKWVSQVLVASLLCGILMPFGAAVKVSAKTTDDEVVISQVFGGGGNSGSTYKNDFIELYNPTNNEIDLSGWSVQYASSAGTSWSATPLKNKIKPHGYYLIQEAAGSGGTTALDSPDDTGTINMAAGAGKVALVKSKITAISGKSDASVVDFVGFGTAASESEGQPTGDLSATTAAVRKAKDGTSGNSTKGSGLDTDANKNDFELLAPIPRNSSIIATTPADSSTSPETADPVGSSIQLLSNGSVTGAVYSVSPGARVDIYYSSSTGGAADVSANVAADGSFSATVTGGRSIYVTATVTGKLSSKAVKIDPAVPAPLVRGAALFANGTSTGTIVGTASAPNSPVYVYSDAGATVPLTDTVSNSTYVMSNASKAFSFKISNPPSKIYVTQKTYGANGRSLESAPLGADKLDTSSTLPIAAVKAVDQDGYLIGTGQTVTVKGIATVANNIVGSNSYFIQDESGGINLYGKAPSFTMAPGDEIEVTGTLDFYGGLTELRPVSMAQKGTAPIPAPVETSVTELSSFASAEPLEGKLAVVTGRVGSVAASGTTAYNVTFTETNSTSKSITVRVVNTTGIKAQDELIIGNSYTVTGIVGQNDTSSPYDQFYQIFPRSSADIVQALDIQHEPMTSAYFNTDVVFNATISGAKSAAVYYRAIGANSYVPLSMSGDQGNYIATLSAAQVPVSGFEYYIEAAPLVGSAVRTAGSAAAPYSVSLVEDTTGPAILNTVPAQDARVESYRPTISFDLNDPSGVNQDSIVVKLDDNTISAFISKTDKKVEFTPPADLALGIHTVSVTAGDMKGNPSSGSWTFEVVQPFTGGNHYRGTTHNHTNISHDAAGTPEDALKAAKAHHYDWFAFSDHSHDIDAGQIGQDTVQHDGKPERTGGADWQLTKQLAAQYTNSQFTVFPAFEMTATTWGHSNVFGTDNFIDRKMEGGLYQDLNSYYSWVLTYDNVAAQFNHPDMSANAFNNFKPYDKNVDKLFTMFEVGNGSGHYGYVNAEKKYFTALDLGWHVAPTFGEDNHEGTWGQTNKRTVIVASDLSQASLLDSMKKHRVYMTEDPNFTLDVLANGQYMGSTVDSKTLQFSVKGSDSLAESSSMADYSYLPANYKSDDRVAKVELVTNGGNVVASAAPMTKDFTWNPSYTVTGGSQWFIVRVTQMDGERMYSAPIWTMDTEVDVKVNGLDIVGGSMVSGTPASLQAGVSNMGTTAQSNLKVNFYYDAVDEAHLIGAGTIDKLNSKTVGTASVIWNNPVTGNHTLIAVLNPINGDNPADNRFEEAVVVKAKLNMTIMIDASHGNENTTTDGVNATYKDNFKLLTSALQREGYTVVENKQPLSAAVLQGVKVLIVTHPASDLTSAENTAVAEYVNGGGSLYLTGKSNFNVDPTINNDLLVAMGSTIQIANDGIFDESKEGNFFSDTKKYNFAIRLHPELVANYLTDRISELEYYSGSSLEKVGHQPLTDSSTVTLIAKGNETTFQSNIKGGSYVYDNVNDTTGGSVIPAIATEKIGSGKLFVAGMNLLNDQQLDDVNSGNDEFAINVFNWLAGRGTVVSTIADARKLPEGADAVVEGTVTTPAGNFFDAFYLQDATGGIMAFKEVPEKSLELGDKARVYGHIKTFENNLELEYNTFDTDVVKLGQSAPVQPKAISTGEAGLDANQGLLVKVKGQVLSQYDDNSYVIDDGSGAVLVFTDGYVINETNVPVPVLAAGDIYEAVGLLGKFADGTRIRVRDTRELSGAAGNSTKLKDLKVDGIGFSFSPATTDYSLSVGNGVASTTVTAVPDNAQAVIEINGEAASSKQIVLAEGVNTITIKVQVQGDYKIYRLQMTRAAAQTVTGTPVQLTTAPVSLNVPEGVVNASMQVVPVTEGDSKQATLPLVEVKAATSLGNIGMNIPSGVKVTAPANWDGVIKLPAVQPNSSVAVSSGVVAAVIEVGVPDMTLTFDKAVRLLVPNQAGKAAGFVKNRVFTPIKDRVSQDTQEAADREIVDGGEAMIEVGSDLVIWTKHFTQFVSYTQVVYTSSNSSSNSGASAISGTLVSGVNGGTVTDQGVKIVIPAGASKNDIRITVAKVTGFDDLTKYAPGSFISEVFDINKDQTDVFTQKVTVSLPADLSKINPAKSDVAVYWFDETAMKWNALADSSVDTAQAVVTGTVDHFGKFAVLTVEKQVSGTTPATPSAELNLSDIAGHWAEQNIRELIKAGAIEGYPDNSFGPDRTITRAEFAAILVKAFKLQEKSGTVFADTQSHWARKYIETAAAYEIISGYSDSSFGPDDRITREQMAAMTVRAAKLPSTTGTNAYTDSSAISDWAKAAVGSAAASHVVDGYPDGTFKPKANATRAEAVSVIVKTMKP
ncbi:S-layer homology domain-containing protein [Paenibacillus thalictri]|uniref:Ig domain-containing protein group 2 domain-containing protein n=1 Tax=Paenibacillus thalictri TaxID=2527873 RepID=A0A4Q9DXN5_9BACL|nr:S-layer homology domain-containing protein [Paenibacillus thalictri]TBL80830.1 Ig domain-containing protein group 2 domain-containing protein [Paenibacillus thalictri]